MLRVSWTEKRTNLEILNTASSTRKLMSNVKRRQAEFLGHVMRKGKLEHLLTTGKIEGKRSRGRQRIKIQDGIADTPQFRGGNPYFFSENPYQSVSFIDALMYRENVHAIHIAMQFAKKISTLCYKNRQTAAKNENRGFISRGATAGLASLMIMPTPLLPF